MLTCKNIFSGLYVLHFMINKKNPILVNFLVTRLARDIQGRVGRGCLYGIQEQGKQSLELVLSLHTYMYILHAQTLRF